MSFRIKLAGKILDITVNNDDRVRKLCEGYLCSNEAPDFQLNISEKQVDDEYELSEKADESGTAQNRILPRGYMVELAVYRAICEKMLSYSTFLMHGSVIAVGEDAFMFTAPSGTGKTTRCRLWMQQVPGSYYVNGDKPLLKVQENDVLASGTPWSGKEHYNTNTMVPLRAIFFLERAEQTSLEQMTFSQAFVPLLRQTYRPKNAELMTRTLRLMKQLDGRVQFYRYRSNLDDTDMAQLYRTVMDDLNILHINDRRY